MEQAREYIVKFYVIKKARYIINQKEIVLFETEDNEIKLEVPVNEETVWLSANQMSVLFDRDEKTIRKHINNVFSDEEVS